MDSFVADFAHNPEFECIRRKLVHTFSQIDVLKVGSMFTGWAVLEMVLDALKAEWNAACSTPSDALLEAVLVVSVFVRKTCG